MEQLLEAELSGKGTLRDADGPPVLSEAATKQEAATCGRHRVFRVLEAAENGVHLYPPFGLDESL